jgi:hypothetical protein
MKDTICDCCKTRRSCGVFVMDAAGIHSPGPAPRQDGFRRHDGIDLCESCSTSLRFHWGENAKTGEP